MASGYWPEWLPIVAPSVSISSSALCAVCKVRCHCIFYGPGIRYSDIFGAPGIREAVIYVLAEFVR